MVIFVLGDDVLLLSDLESRFKVQMSQYLSQFGISIGFSFFQRYVVMVGSNYDCPFSRDFKGFHGLPGFGVELILEICIIPYKGFILIFCTFDQFGSPFYICHIHNARSLEFKKFVEEFFRDVIHDFSLFVGLEKVKFYIPSQPREDDVKWSLGCDNYCWK